MKELIEFLEVNKFNDAANDLKKGINCLDLSNSYLGFEVAEKIATAIKNKHVFMSFDLSSAHIGDKGVKVIFEALKTNIALHFLNLMNNTIADEGAKEISEFLKTNKTLISLNLKWNSIGDEGMKAIGSTLKTNITLRYLDLGFNPAPEGLKVIAEALKTNTSLIELDLGVSYYNRLIEDYITRNINLKSENEKKATILGAQGDVFCIDKQYDKALEKYNEAINLTDVAGKHITKKLSIEKKYKKQQTQELISLLKKMGAIIQADNLNNGDTSLNLQQNNLTNKEVAQIAKALKSNIALTSLTLRSSSKGIELITDALKINTVLTSLNLEENKDSKVKKIFSSLIWNTNTREKAINEYLQRNIILKEENNPQAEALNAYGNIYCAQKEYYRAIEYYNEAIIISPKPLYISNKKNAKKNYKKEQSQSSNQVILVVKKENDQKAAIKIIEKPLYEENKINAEKNLAAEGDVFEKIANEINVKIANNTTINAKDKTIMEDTIKDIPQKTKLLTNKTDIDQIINSLQKLLTDKLVKSKLMAIDEQLDELIERQNKTDNDLIVNIVKEIIYDKPLLNHPELLGAAMEKFSLKEIGERIDELSPCLIDAAINSEEGELIILGGLMSLDNSAAPGS
nr:tetratricopeptide repeat protein [Rickettsia endosymbiont of Ceutorhynchus assimilis]